jgi:hypothetical protein
MATDSAVAEGPEKSGADLIRDLADAFDLPNKKGKQQRSSPRFPLNFSMKLFPLGGLGKRLHFEPMSITGRDISSKGLGFIHEHQIPDKRVIIYCYRPGAARFAFEAQIMWTTPSTHGGFESGCQLVRKLPPNAVAEIL